MCSCFKILGVILFLAGIGMLLGIIIPVNTFLLAVIFIAIGLCILIK